MVMKRASGQRSVRRRHRVWVDLDLNSCITSIWNKMIDVDPSQPESGSSLGTCSGRTLPTTVPSAVSRSGHRVTDQISR